jgi:hypothetical protein
MGRTSVVARRGQGRTTLMRSYRTHAAELSANKRKELGDSQKHVRLQTQRKSPRVMQKIINNDKIIFRI